jgi:16S rRNA (adenine1518-N6/adenine1519-N6)-dimethyltransferase
MSGAALPPLRDVIARHGLRAHKSYGQNFILDLNLTRKIARSVPDLGESMIYEVGPGPGGLTRALLEEGADRVVAIEKDTRCQPALEEIAAAYPGRLSVQSGDALAVSESDLLADGDRPVQVAANLPYNVGTALLVKWLSVETWPPWYQSLTLMFQREVAQRIVAGPGSKSYGRLAILAQWRCAARILFDIPPQAFTPSPKVSSSLVQLSPRAKPEGDRLSAKDIGALTRAAFGQRRKMLKSSLKSLGSEIPAILKRLDIDPTLRAEELSVSQYCAIASRLGRTRPV